MEWAIYVMPVVHVYKSPLMAIMAIMVIVHIQTTNSGYSSTVIVDIYFSNLTYPSVIIIIYRNILNLDNCTVIVILNIGVIIIT